MLAGLDAVQDGCSSDPAGIVSGDPSRGDVVNRTALAPISAVLLAGSLGAEMPANTEVAASVEWRVWSSQSVLSGTTERVSVSSTESQAVGHSGGPSVSGSGRYVAFSSLASNLVPEDSNERQDVFVRDRGTGTTERVSLSSSGTQANLRSFQPAVSGDGRYVAFISEASNLVPGDTNGERDVFVRDRETGTTELVSVSSSGTQANLGSIQPAVSGDGRYVAYISAATNLVPGETDDRPDVFVRDRQAGTTELVSVSSSETHGNQGGLSAALSGDGRYVAFASHSSNLVAGDTNGLADVFVRDQETGTTERVSVRTSGAQLLSFSATPAISRDGRYVAFESDEFGWAPGDDNTTTDVFVRDREAGTTEWVSVTSQETPIDSQGDSGSASLSTHGRYVAFTARGNVFLRDRATGTTERVSISIRTHIGRNSSLEPAISAGGRYVAFTSYKRDLVPGDTNRRRDVFIRDRRP